MEWHNFILHETNISQKGIILCEKKYILDVVPTKLFFITKLKAHHRTSDKKLKKCSSWVIIMAMKKEGRFKKMAKKQLSVG